MYYPPYFHLERKSMILLIYMTFPPYFHVGSSLFSPGEKPVLLLICMWILLTHLEVPPYLHVHVQCHVLALFLCRILFVYIVSHGIPTTHCQKRLVLLHVPSQSTLGALECALTGTELQGTCNCEE